MSEDARDEGMRWIAVGAALGGVAVAAGAFGAHGLRDLVMPERVATFETAVRYHLAHALLLVMIGFLSGPVAPRLLRISATLVSAGVALFSGSLYLLVLTDTPWLGAVAPVGGTAFIAGWAALAAWAFNRRRLPRTGG